jgi:Xaa-Pro aminopeptidase
VGADHVMQLAGYERYLGGPVGVVVGADGERTLAVLKDEAPAASESSDADRVVPYGEHGFGFDLNPVPTLVRELAATDVLSAARRLGVVDGLGGMKGHLAESCGAELVDASAALAEIRLIPDADELVHLLRSYELSWVGQRAVGDAAIPGATEIELFDAACSAAQLAHGAPISFAADLVSGADTAKVGAPVVVPGGRAVENGDPVVADIVIGAGGYGGDTAETHIVGENAEIADMRAALLDILAACGAELRPGNTGAEVFAFMHARVKERFPEAELPHHAGHAVSLTAFEDPHMIPSDHTPLQSWMLISLEPGAYVAGRFGSRVENSFIVTPSGGLELRDALGAR